MQAIGGKVMPNPEALLLTNVVKGHVTFVPGRSARIVVKRKDNVQVVDIGPGYYARIAQQGLGGLKEVTVTSSANDCSLIVTRIVHESNKTTRRILTEFANKVSREDQMEVQRGAVQRSTKWNYPNGFEIRANYSQGRRDLTVLKAGREIGRYETTGKLIGKLLQADTQQMDGGDDGVIIIGDKTVRPGSSTTIIVSLNQVNR
jgi:hypothetical protein